MLHIEHTDVETEALPKLAHFRIAHQVVKLSKNLTSYINSVKLNAHIINIKFAAVKSMTEIL